MRTTTDMTPLWDAIHKRLSSCPMCGAKPTMLRDETDAYVQCDGCSVQINLDLLDDERDEDVIQPYMVDALVDTWNRRWPVGAHARFAPGVVVELLPEVDNGGPLTGRRGVVLRRDKDTDSVTVGLLAGPPPCEITFNVDDVLHKLEVAE